MSYTSDEWEEALARYSVVTTPVYGTALLFRHRINNDEFVANYFPPSGKLMNLRAITATSPAMVAWWRQHQSAFEKAVSSGQLLARTKQYSDDMDAISILGYWKDASARDDFVTAVGGHELLHKTMDELGLDVVALAGELPAEKVQQRLAFAWLSAKRGDRCRINLDWPGLRA